MPRLAASGATEHRPTDPAAGGGGEGEVWRGLEGYLARGVRRSQDILVQVGHSTAPNRNN